MRDALVEGFAILSFMVLMAVMSSCLPQATHDPVSPDLHVAGVR
jgi:hypothetical protein